ncbi:chitin synthase [Synchytrium microbalum]|uniref:Chitin synthase n=1 Tax=Synchytrium microbalum TaxID=1806994 RepID=A0A507CEJ1_9FUNG|nr:chitin synthase [Synchytrium microbalum]TPX35933.1 chitin synthase [Synchytrium microbalum]
MDLGKGPSPMQPPRSPRGLPTPPNIITTAPSMLSDTSLYLDDSLRTSTATAANSPNPIRRRETIIRHVPNMKNRNYVVEVPVSDETLKNAKFKIGPEFTTLRYTAATCGADEYSQNYTLRQAEYGRHTKIAVVVTMYNESEELFTKTLTAVMRNKNQLKLESCRKFISWGSEGWKNIVVVIVSDGRTKINPKVLDVLNVMGCYMDGLMQTTVQEKEVVAHVFEHTAQIAVNRNMEIRTSEEDYVPVQFLFCLKEKNAKKINSHRWFFNAFGKVLQPETCMLIDVGTRPTNSSFYHLFRAFERDPAVAGCCGEIAAELGTAWNKLLNPLVAAQNFEYKMSNILDKPLESVFGFISVLPGAFSAYRYRALIDGPLDVYFRGEALHGGSQDIMAANMYLAEDRILFDLSNSEVLSADAHRQGFGVRVDPFYPWGPTIFAVIREVYLGAIVLVFISSMGNRPQGSSTLYYVIVVLFASIFIVMQVHASFLAIYSVYLAIVAAANSGNNIWFDFKSSPTFRDVVISLTATYGVYVVSSILHMDPWHIVTSMIQYFLLLPSYINLFMVYAFCNLNDVSWGTKGDNGGSQQGLAPSGLNKANEPKDVAATVAQVNEVAIAQGWTTAMKSLEAVRINKGVAPPKQKRDANTKMEDWFKLFRTRTVLLWMFSNALMIIVFTSPSLETALLHHDIQGSVNPFLTFLFWSVTILSLIRFMGSTIYLVSHYMAMFEECLGCAAGAREPSSMV